MLTSILLILLNLYPEVRWDYRMQVIPEGWISENWDYNPLYWTTLSIWADEPGQYEEGHLYSGADSVLIPPNCDSIILEVEQMYLDFTEEGWGSAWAKINYRYYSEWHEAWHEYGLDSHTGVFSISIPVTHWEHLSLDFNGGVNVSSGGSGFAHLIWGLKFLSLTLWCDGTAIDYETWAHIKNEFTSIGELR